MLFKILEYKNIIVRMITSDYFTTKVKFFLNT